jgi:hypothetical protein
MVIIEGDGEYRTCGQEHDRLPESRVQAH